MYCTLMNFPFFNYAVVVISVSFFYKTFLYRECYLMDARLVVWMACERSADEIDTTRRDGLIATKDLKLKIEAFAKRINYGSEWKSFLNVNHSCSTPSSCFRQTRTNNSTAAKNRDSLLCVRSQWTVMFLKIKCYYIKDIRRHSPLSQ